MFLYSLAKLFDEDWNCNVKVIQKDLEFSLKQNLTKQVKVDDTDFYVVNCSNVFVADKDVYNKDITNNQEFSKEFEKLCKLIIDKDFTLFRNPEASVHYWLDDFFEEEHGSGVMALFWLFYNIKANDVKNIVIDNIDGLLHYSSMIQLSKVLKRTKDYKFIFLMNNYVLFSTAVSEIEDLYMLHNNRIANIQKCTDRELRISHNLENLLKAGEFDNILE